jgi:hypothetical protein
MKRPVEKCLLQNFLLTLCIKCSSNEIGK